MELDGAREGNLNIKMVKGEFELIPESTSDFNLHNFIINLSGFKQMVNR